MVSTRRRIRDEQPPDAVSLLDIGGARFYGPTWQREIGENRILYLFPHMVVPDNEVENSMSGGPALGVIIGGSGVLRIECSGALGRLCREGQSELLPEHIRETSKQNQFKWACEEVSRFLQESGYVDTDDSAKAIEAAKMHLTSDACVEALTLAGVIKKST